jgi:CHAD domain-containing protein
MRVATRRLRAARRVFGEAVAGAVDLERAGAELRTLAAALGRVRDPDVFVAALGRHAREAPVEDRAALRRLATVRKRERDAARAELRRVLDGDALAYLRGDFRAALQDLASARPGARRGSRARRGTVRRQAPRMIVRALRRLYRREDELLAPSGPELHARRIAAKRVRYACEFFAPAFGGRLDEPIARLTAVQEALGELHDTDVAVGALLGAIEGVATAPEPAGPAGARGRAADAGPIARLAARSLAGRDGQLAAFREQWTALPRPRRLRRLLAERT